MANIVVDKPYVFVPPVRQRWPLRMLQLFLPFYLRRQFGVSTLRYIGGEHLQASLAAGHGILLTPNHSRGPDALVMTMLGRHLGTEFFSLASWHLFMEGLGQRLLLRAGGAFSIYREAVDRKALSASVAILEAAERPLVIFPEGRISRSNEALGPLLDGFTMIARTAARNLKKKDISRQIVVHPVAIRYAFNGDLEATLHPALTRMEKRLSWAAQDDLTLMDRIVRLGEALLSLKEKEYGLKQDADEATFAGRIDALTEHILRPLEDEWLSGKRQPEVLTRVKMLRMAILPKLIEGELAPDEHARYWRIMDTLFFVQQLSCYPPGYLSDTPSQERLLETVERFEEDFLDEIGVHGPISVEVEVGPAIEVTAEKLRPDPLTDQVASCLSEMLARR